MALFLHGLLPASFRGAPFAVIGQELGGGRRIALHQYPGKDDPWAEDMGRAARSFRLRGFIVDGDILLAGGPIQLQRLLLVAALEKKGPGVLVHPTLGIVNVVVNRFSVGEELTGGQLSSVVHAVDVLASLERDVFAAIGGHALNAITRPAVLELLRQVERRGRRETARRLRQRVSAVFEYAMSEGWCEDNPAAVVRRAMLKPAAQRKQPALTDIDALRGLIAAVERLVADPAVKLASRFLALTAVRLAAEGDALMLLARNIRHHSRWDESD